MSKARIIKYCLFAMLTAVLVFSTSVSASGTISEVSRVQYFTIQNNNVCTTANHATTFYFNLNNISNNSVDITVYLYNDLGDEVTRVGSMGGAMGEYKASTFTPGTMFTLDGKSTVHYYTGFGKSAGECSDIPAYGKIVVHSDSGLIMANGEIKGVDLSTSVVYRILTQSQVIVNGANPF